MRLETKISGQLRYNEAFARPRGGMQFALRELLTGDDHFAVILGNGDQQRSARNALSDRRRRFSVLSGFILCAGHGSSLSRGPIIRPGMFAVSPEQDSQVLAKRYYDGTAQYTLPIYPADFIQALATLDEEGLMLVAATATIGESSNIPEFDALFVPDIWQTVPTIYGTGSYSASILAAAAVHQAVGNHIS